MKKSDIKRILRDEAARVVPDVRGRVLAAARPVKPAEKKRGRRAGWAAGIAAVCVACAITLGLTLPGMLGGGKNNPTLFVPDYATVCLKMNPSVELTVTDGAVTAARALNPDGAVILAGAELVGMAPADASLTIAGIADRSEYLTEAGVTVRVAGKDEDALARSIVDALSGSYTVRLDEPDDKTAKDAEKYGVTPGFMQLVYAVREKDKSLSVAKLVKMDADDLLDMLEDYDEAAMEAYEKRLQDEFAALFPDFVRNVETLLKDYVADLTDLKGRLGGMTEKELDKAVKAFNEKFARLGSEYALERFEEMPEAEDFDDYIEAAEETLEDIGEDADDVFEDMYEDWLDDFRAGQKNKEKD